MEPHHDKDGSARSTEISRESNVFLEQVKMNYQNKPDVYNELLRLLSSNTAARNEAHRHISTQVEYLFRGTLPDLARLLDVLTRTVRMEDTPYAAALVNSAINRIMKITIGSTAAEDSVEERIEERVMKMTQSIINNFSGFIVDDCLFEGFSQLLPGTMEVGGASRFHKEEGKQYMELVIVYFSNRPDVCKGYGIAINDFERRRIRANRRLYV
ncbi:hypothetical protein V491_07362 [Pseudogymnoascus sp. VKM F-3775]|nr:hypothetical protein V491_07362 [Pseudogymnoascus sp. VKM F-3775]